jgi:PAS domain S-box-containing protein
MSRPTKSVFPTKKPFRPQDAGRQAVIDTLLPMSVGFGILSGLNAGFDYFNDSVFNLFLDLATCAVMSVFAVILRRYSPPPRWADFTASIIGLVMLSNITLSFYRDYFRDTTPEIYLSFCIIGLGVVLLATRAYFVMIALCVISWLTVTALHADTNILIDKILHLLVACGFSLLVFVSRRKTYGRLETELVEREATESALVRSERRYRDLVSNQGEAMIMLDADRRLSFCNNAAEELFHQSRQSLLGRTLSELLTVSEMESVSKGIDPCTNGERTRFEIDLRVNGNDTRCLLVTATPMHTEDGQFEGILALLRDNTERKLSEEKQRQLSEQLKHAQKLESLGVLAGGIAHDFNNILMGVSANADLLLKGSDSDPETRECLAEIVSASKRAAELCRQMLGYSGKGKFVTDSVDLSKVIRDMGDLLEISVTKKASIKYQLSNVLPSIDADAAQLGQVAINLVTNAAEALDKDEGEIILTTNMTYLDHSYVPQSYLPFSPQAGPYVTLEVTDNGCGMNEQTKTKVFDPFFSTKFIGRGLGLPAVLGIVRGHNGVVEVFSEKDKGSTFRVMFPASNRKAVLKENIPMSSQDWRGSGLILLVDDEPTVIRAGARMLKRMGFDVITAEDGAAAVEIVKHRAEDISLVILDQTMPRMSGSQAFREISKIATRLRVIISSGYSEMEIASDLIPGGLSGFLPKPYDLGQLRSKLQTLFEGGSAFDSIHPPPPPTENGPQSLNIS